MNRDQVFISYSRRDKVWLDRLRTMLVPLMRDGVKVWADTDIKPGEEWRPAIEAALASAKVALLLVSPDFLASRFIHENELPPLLDAARTQGLTILWVLVRPCYYQRSRILGYQAAFDPKSPLSALQGAKREAALAKIVELIDQLMADPAQSQASPVGSLRPVGEGPSILSPLPAGEGPSIFSPLPVGEGLGVREKRTIPLPPLENIHGWPAAKVQALQQATAKALGRPVVFRDRLGSGGEGPELLIIPAGEFIMGAPEGEAERQSWEGPQHRVIIAKPFALGRSAVTRGEFASFVQATGYRTTGEQQGGIYVWSSQKWRLDPTKNWRQPGFEQGDDHPVVGVSWQDAKAYCDWLLKETGADYRLPSEAEWEYGARAGTTTAFWWGDEIDTKRANYDGNFTYRNGTRGEYRKQTLPVATFEPNPFGLYQVHGNVWEWVQDQWHEDYSCAPNDGSAWEISEAGDSLRVVRGGSWFYEPRWLRGAARNWLNPDDWNYSLGFRLARTISLSLFGFF